MLPSDDERTVAPRVDEQAAAERGRINLVVREYRSNASLDLFAGIFKIVVPDAERLADGVPEKIAPSRHRDGFAKLQARLANAAGREGARQVFADEMAAIEPFATRELLWVAPHVGFRTDEGRGWCRGRVYLPIKRRCVLERRLIPADAHSRVVFRS